ncbi:cysteine desulfurase family protein [Xanthomonas sp. SHU 199]|uniref:cysteine desulfurase family protein n=1 Tax=Xanthomonas sp. SHU 199 TaxID=1591174 RepID=UPI0009DAAE73|nr:aminotransferase class V-fold PLP-dependent enzyme [Xanthomonas sp. SHU 199]
MSGRRPLYLDHNASTPPRPEVVDAMLPWLREQHANPHSDHIHGRLAARAVEQAGHSVARLIGASPEEIIFTSGATEASNLALQGYLRGRADVGALIYSAIEHPCVREVAIALSELGARVQEVEVDRQGHIDPLAIGQAIMLAGRVRSLVSVIHANNEIGTVQAIAPLAAAAHAHGALFHLDVSQSLAWLDIDVSEGIDLATLSSHKIGGPAGIGALFVADGLKNELTPLIHGGGQQGGLRSGTIPVFLAVGFGAACDLVSVERARRILAAERAANAFTRVLTDGGVTFEIMGSTRSSLPGLRSIRFPGTEARDLLDRLQTELSASPSSACASGDFKASHVLRAIGMNEVEAMQVIRFGFSSTTSVQDAEIAAQHVSSALMSTSRAESIVI